MTNLKIVALLVAHITANPLAMESKEKMVQDIRLPYTGVVFQTPSQFFFDRLKEACLKATPVDECRGKVARIELLAKKSLDVERRADVVFSLGERKKAIDLIRAAHEDEDEIRVLYENVEQRYPSTWDITARLREQRRKIWR